MAVFQEKLKLIKKEILLNVYRRFARLKNGEQNEFSTTKIARLLNTLIIDEMTSLDLNLKFSRNTFIAIIVHTNGECVASPTK